MASYKDYPQYPRRNRRPNALGTRLDEITADIDEFYSRPAQGRELPSDENPYGATGRRSLLLGIPDFEPYILDTAQEYYQGPNRSTRVSAHQFVPDDPDIISKISEATESGTLSQRQFMDFNITGLIYVRFIKNNSLWRYGIYTPIPLAEYRNFRNSVSKGRSVRYLEQYGHGEVVSVPAGVGI